VAFLRVVFALALAVLAPGSSPAVAAGDRWQWPVRGPVTERFHVARDRFARGQHRGIDIRARSGTPVRSACAGRVSFAGVVPGGGRTLSVRCGDLTATYQHLATLAAHRGASAAAGARLGTAGATALHFGVHRTADRHAYLDPLSLLGRERRRPAPPVPVVRRRPSRDPFGPAPPPRPLPRRTAARPAHLAIRSPEAGGVPPLAWVGAGLAVLALPGWGVRGARRRRSRMATKRLASSARANQAR
jgi:murein DD-endopeptidase MepM/ murein hydrolase activator NlpD